MFRNLLYIDRGNGTGDVDLALGGVADDHDFVEELVVFVEADGHFGFGHHGLCLESDVRDNEVGAFGNCNFEIAVDVGGDTVCRAFDAADDACPQQRFVVCGRNNSSVHGDVLRL